MRVLFLLLAARSGAGVAGSELLQRREWPRGVVLGLSRGRDHYAVLAAAHGAALSSAAPQQRLQAVQHNASGLSGAMRRLAGLCDGADPWARDAQSARVPVAESAWLARSAKAFPAIWATPNCAKLCAILSLATRRSFRLGTAMGSLNVSAGERTRRILKEKSTYAN